VQTVTGADPVELVLKKMAETKVHHVFVIDAAGRPLDVINNGHVLRFLLEEF